MKKNDLKKVPLPELRSLLSEKRNSLRDFRFRISRGKVKNVKESRSLRAEIARILTEVNKREK